LRTRKQSARLVGGSTDKDEAPLFTGFGQSDAEEPAISAEEEDVNAAEEEAGDDDNDGDDGDDAAGVGLPASASASAAVAGEQDREEDELEQVASLSLQSLHRQAAEEKFAPIIAKALEHFSSLDVAMMGA